MAGGTGRDASTVTGSGGVAFGSAGLAASGFDFIN
jgi:hypothetical protein